MKIIILGSVLFTKVVDFLIKKNIAIDGVIGKKILPLIRILLT